MEQIVIKRCLYPTIFIGYIIMTELIHIENNTTVYIIPDVVPNMVIATLILVPSKIRFIIVRYFLHVNTFLSKKVSFLILTLLDAPYKKKLTRLNNKINKLFINYRFPEGITEL